MKILIAPDKFKGSLTAQQVCEAIREGITVHRDNDHVALLPMADGGDGTRDVLTSIARGSLMSCRVHDPLGRIIDASYGLSLDRQTAFIEMAAASGLVLLKKDEYDPMRTSTYGTGELMAHALDAGVKHIVIGIGGSATNDGGMGMAKALGVQFISGDGKSLQPCGENLQSLQHIDASAIHHALNTTTFTVLCDVDNPLYGPQGAAAIYAPQKGATPSMVKMLDAGLQQLARCIKQELNHEANFPGAGAGGGLPVMLHAIATVKIMRGMDYMISFSNLEERITEAELVITGEGALDEQTFSGKVVNEVSALARKHHKILWVVAGKCELNKKQRDALHADKIFVLADGAASETDSINHAAALIKDTIGAAIATFS